MNIELEIEKNMNELLGEDVIDFGFDKNISTSELDSLLKKLYKQQIKKYHPDQAMFSNFTVDELKKKFENATVAYQKLEELYHQYKDKFTSIFNQKYKKEKQDNHNGKYSVDNYNSKSRTFLQPKGYSYKLSKFMMDGFRVDAFDSQGLCKSFMISQSSETILGKQVYQYFIGINATDVSEHIYQATLFGCTNILDIIRFYQPNGASERSYFATLGLDLLTDYIIDSKKLEESYQDRYGYLGDLQIDNNQLHIVYSMENQEFIKNSPSIQESTSFLVKDWKGREVRREYSSQMH